MRYLLLIFVSSLLSLLPQLSVTATDTQTKEVRGQSLKQFSQSPDFWPEAQRLVQDQIYLINRIERALADSDPNRLFGARGQITLHRGQVQRFLESQYPIPDLLCSRTNGVSPAGSRLSFQQATVYCALYESTQQLPPLRPLLERRESSLGAPTFPFSRNQSSNLEQSRERLSIPAAEVPPAEPPIVGKPAKTPISGYKPTISPAIAPPPDAITGLQTVKQRLSEAIAAFPPSTRFVNSAETNQAIELLAYTINPREVELYSQFIRQPRNGIARVLPAEAYLPKPNQLRNRLVRPIVERFPFAPLRGQAQSRYLDRVQNPPQENGFVPRLTVRVEDGNFQIVEMGLDYGFMVDLGETPLDNLNSTLSKVPTLSPQTREFFFSYEPPNELEALQKDRRRFLTAKLGDVVVGESVIQTELINNSLMGVSTRAPVVMNHTYLVRLVQFQLPNYVLNQEPITRTNRRYLPLLLETPSSDLLVAFQPVNKRIDGSYTVLWRVLNQFPDPQVKDLNEYIYFQSFLPTTSIQ